MVDQSSSPRCILVTGFPGFIARVLTRRVLETDATATLRLLAQEAFVEGGRRFLGTLDDAQRARCTILTGDVCALDLGLSGPEVEQVAADVTHVFHLAALKDPDASDAALERVNVSGTRNVLHLCRSLRRLDVVCHMSSAHVAGDRTGVVTEDELDEGQGFRDAYEASKFRAEVEVRRHRDTLPIMVLRPTIVVGDSRTGRVDRFDGIYYLGIMLLAQPARLPHIMPGEATAPLHLVPVDFVVAAADALARDRGAIGKTFHIADPSPLSTRQIYELLARESGMGAWPTIQLPGPVTRLTARLMRAPGLDRLTRRERQALNYVSHQVHYRAVNTLRHLHGTDVQCPPVEDYIHNLVRYVRIQLERERRRREAAAEDPLDFDGDGGVVAPV